MFLDQLQKKDGSIFGDIVLNHKQNEYIFDRIRGFIGSI